MTAIHLEKNVPFKHDAVMISTVVSMAMNTICLFIFEAAQIALEVFRTGAYRKASDAKQEPILGKCQHTGSSLINNISTVHAFANSKGLSWCEPMKTK